MIRESFNQGWFVTKESPADSHEPVGPVTVPYDAMLFEARDPATPNSHHTGFYPGGVYRYSKSFPVPEDWRGRSITLEFEGVYMRSEVLVNGTPAGGRPCGYAMFHVEIDDLLVYGKQNTVEVVAHNDQMPNSRWYTGSGIYRPVHLLVGGRVRVIPNGLRFSTKSLDNGTAVVAVATSVINDSLERRDVEVTASVTSPHHVTTTSTDKRVWIEPGETARVVQQLTVTAADLWSPDVPDLYQGAVVVRDGAAVLDTAAATFGIRTIQIDAQHGFRINGVQMKLRGACIHHDNGVIGAHTLDAAEDRRIRILKESGFNAIRSAHNPASSATLRACDRHGMLVMDELTDAWWRPKIVFDGSNEFEQWWERDLEAMVAKDFNHPSVIIYSIGNEIPETATERGIHLNRRLADRTRELDPTRLVTNCINGFLNLICPMDDEKLAKKNAEKQAGGEEPNKNLIVILNHLMGVLEKTLKYIVRLPTVDKRTHRAFDALDVAGYNYMAGRYKGDAERYPLRVMVGSETNPNDAVATWSEVEHMPSVIGDFMWTGWDYIGEAGYGVVLYGEKKRQMFAPWPGLTSGTPVIDITGQRQTQSYLNEIGWHRRKGPHLAVQPVNHSGEQRLARAGRTDSIRSWSWEGCEGRVATVEVYADADRVELSLNGVRVGRGRVGERRMYLAEFTLPYRPGVLTAVAYNRNGAEVGRDSLISADSGLRLSVEPETPTLIADGADLVYLPIELTDDAGIVRPVADREVTVQVSGAGTLLGFGSAQPITEEGFSSPRHRTYLGRSRSHPLWTSGRSCRNCGQRRGV